MPTLSITSDPETLTITAKGEYPVSVERLWSAFADPRKLERFWGPPTWPATFTRHELTPGGRSEYFMTGPEGQKSHGFWNIEHVEPGQCFVAVDGFSNPDGSGIPEMPNTMLKVTFEATKAGARFTAISTFASLEAMERLIAMGAVEGYRSVLAQLGDVLADLREMSQGVGTTVEADGECVLVVRRVVRGALEQVWRAHREAALIKQWMLGPEGWEMPVCEPPKAVGDQFRYVWEKIGGGERFGFEGELLACEAPKRLVTTEKLIGADVTPNTNVITFTPKPGNHTLIEVTIGCASQRVRDQMLETPMADGMEASYARLESVVNESDKNLDM